MKIKFTLFLLILGATFPGFEGKSVAQTVAPGFGFSIFICSNGSVSVSGANSYGQLGNGSKTLQSTPVLLTSLSGISAAAAGDSHSLFLKNDGTVWACGRNLFGQLGDGTNADKLTPVQITSLSGIKAIETGSNYSLFLKNDGTVWSCGANVSGSNGDGTNTASNTPVKITAVSGITAIAAGGFHSMFLKGDGTVWACGGNQNGELGIGTQSTSQLTPVQVTLLSGIKAISASSTHSLFLKNDGTVWACGDNKYGALGDNTTTNKSTPAQIAGLTGIKSISAGDYFSLFLKDDGTVWGCGVNLEGELGLGTVTLKYLVPVQITAATGINAIFTGGNTTFFIKPDNTIWSTGYNNNGELGDGSRNTTNSVVRVKNLCSSATAVETLSENPQISVYPNPNNGDFRLVLNRIPSGCRLAIYNHIGEQKSVQEITSSSAELNLTDFSKGIYFYKLENQNKLIGSGKIVVY
jgi:alpha-tubulin suppressor-like RCC1 family protein